MTFHAPSAKLLLVADRRSEPSEQGNSPVRRYRLARLRLDGRAGERQSRFEHLRSAHD